jgi:hypothetical protein
VGKPEISLVILYPVKICHILRPTGGFEDPDIFS